MEHIPFNETKVTCILKLTASLKEVPNRGRDNQRKANIL
jgi:hypothetical protein